MTSASVAPTILIIGASRGLGHAMAAQFVRRGWDVVGTVRRQTTRTLLHDLEDEHPGRVEVEILDINEPDQLAALKQRLDGRVFDTLFVNAGTTNDNPDDPIGIVSEQAFMHVMRTNALGPMRVIEAFEANVSPTGMIGVMSSGQGSVGNNTTGRRELYRASKAALNMSMRSFAARHVDSSRAMVLMAPGWIRTALGGPEAPFTLDDNVPKLVDVLLAEQGTPGLRYLDYRGRTVPW